MSGKPMCEYGSTCYRKNPAHFEEYDHPPGFTRSSSLTPTLPSSSSVLPSSSPVTPQAGSGLLVSRFFKAETPSKVSPPSLPPQPSSAVVDLVDSDDSSPIAIPVKKRKLPAALSAPAPAPAPAAPKAKAPPKKRTKKGEIEGVEMEVVKAPPKSKKVAEPIAKSAVNVNEKLTSILIELGRVEQATGDKFRSTSYFRAAQMLKTYPTVITSGKEAMELKGIGKGIAKKIDEIIATGKLQRLEDSKNDERVQALKDLERVYGIGPVFAKKLYEEHKVKSLEDLASRQDDLELSDSQKIGLKYVRDFETRIPRKELEAMEALLKREAAAMDPRLLVTICGSYRRGLPDCGDIDVLITHPDFVSPDGKMVKEPPAAVSFLGKFVSCLESAGFVTDTLALGSMKFMGVCVCPPSALPPAAEACPSASPPEPSQTEAAAAPSAAPTALTAPVIKLSLPSLDELDDDGDAMALSQFRRGGTTVPKVRDAEAPKVVSFDSRTFAGPDFSASSAAGATVTEALHRRIDIRYSPYNCYWCGVMYFTGDSIVNTELRVVAQQKGMKLSEYCLALEDGAGAALPVTCEEDVYKHLGVPYQQPHERNH